MLAPYAASCETSRGRRVSETRSPNRTEYQRDRDRIVHCAAFRRLEYKTQVFVNHEGDLFRTRLTHSVEVAQIARTLARSLQLNEDLVEAISLAHDLGHTAFGHAGQDALNECMKPYGGFEHNIQSLRVVDVLERRSPEYRGLNLTLEVKDCLKKHEEVIDPDSGARLRFPLLEAQLVDLADSTAYHYHDVDDGIREGILDPLQMEQDLEIWSRACSATRQRHPAVEPDRLFWQRVVNEMLGMTIGDIRRESEQRLAEAQPATPLEAQSAERRLIGHSEEFRSMVAKLHAYLYEHMYFREEVNWHVRRSTDLLQHLVQHLFENPSAVPAEFFDTADSHERAVCDFVAGMTDRYAVKIAEMISR